MDRTADPARTGRVARGQLQAGTGGKCTNVVVGGRPEASEEIGRDKTSNTSFDQGAWAGFQKQGSWDPQSGLSMHHCHLERTVEPEVLTVQRRSNRRQQTSYHIMTTPRVGYHNASGKANSCVDHWAM